MARVLNLTNQLKTEEKFVKIGENSYKVDDSKNNVMKMQAILSDGEGNINEADLIIETLLGKKAAKEINGMNLSMGGFKALAVGLMALINDMEYEDAEARFLEHIQ